MQNENEIFENLAPSFDEDFITEMFANSIEIYNKIERYDLTHKQSIPKVKVINYPKKDDCNEYPNLHNMLQSDDDANRYWVNQCLDKLKEKGLYNKTYLDRLEDEADIKRIIGEKLETNMFMYPITLQHYIDLIWECGSSIGAGRGSSCSGLNHYLLGVTQLDPIQWDLPFWRYLNRERIELPDIDIDISPSRRSAILKEIKKERGQNFNENVDELSRKNLGCTLVATFGTEGTRSTILTACFKKGTLVKTLQGEKPIELISSDDIVYTSNGWEQVITPTELLDKNIIKIRTRNSTNDFINCTPDHEFLTISKCHKGRIEGTFKKENVINYYPDFKKYKSTDRLYQRVYGYWREISPSWTAAKDIDPINDYGLKRIDLFISEEKPIIKWKNSFKRAFGIGLSEEIKIDDNLCELIGIWLAEGSSNGTQITFTIHQKEEKFKQRIIKLMWNVFKLDNVSIYNRKDSLAMNISYSSKQLIEFFQQLFEVEDLTTINQWNKYIPNKLKYINPKQQMQIFKGWFIGDGWSANPQASKREGKGITVSKQLADDMIFILNRNFINPFVQKENRINKATVYNIMFYQDKADILYQMKYKVDNYDSPFNFPLDSLTEMDFPVIWNNQLYLKTRLERVKEFINHEDKVYCLKVPSQNFTVNDTIVHNCRGYRSEEFPAGIDNDIAQYMSSLIPSERGFLWSLHDAVYGNKEKDRKPITAFINEVQKYEGLLDIMIMIEGIVNKRSSHASGVLFFDEDPYEHCAFMRTPKGEIITQWDLHMVETAGNTKFDFLVTEAQDKIVTTIELLQKDNKIDNNLSLREIYNKYLHPDILDINNEKIWDAIDKREVIDLFQFDSTVGSQAIKKIQPRMMRELSDANGLMRLMATEKDAEMPMDKYVRFKNNISLWYKEMKKYGLIEKEIEILKPHFESSYGVPPSQEQLMTMLMDSGICGFTLAEANDARKIVGKKQMSRIPELKEKIMRQATSQNLGKYVWDNGIGPQMG